MNQINISDYNLKLTLLSGQTFSWSFDPTTNLFEGFTQDKYILLKQDGDKLFWQTYPQKDDFEYIKKYLRLDVDFSEIKKAISVDNHIKNALQHYPNLRLLQQDFELTLLSFILSQHKNIKAIQKCFDLLRYKFGTKLNINNKQVYLFPKAEQLMYVKEEDLKSVGIGFRYKYLKDAVCKLVETNLKESIKRANEDKARELLKQIYGVGDKVADCVLSFALKFDTVTPVDVWGQRVITNLYADNSAKSYADQRNWFKNKFGQYSAWAGQYLFEYVRKFQV